MSLTAHSILIPDRINLFNIHSPLTPLHMIVESYKETGKDVGGLLEPG